MIIWSKLKKNPKNLIYGKFIFRLIKKDVSYRTTLVSLRFLVRIIRSFLSRSVRFSSLCSSVRPAFFLFVILTFIDNTMRKSYVHFYVLYMYVVYWNKSLMLIIISHVTFYFSLRYSYCLNLNIKSNVLIQSPFPTIFLFIDFVLFQSPNIFNYSQYPLCTGTFASVSVCWYC